MSNPQEKRAYQLVLDLDHPLAETRRAAARELMEMGTDATFPLIDGFGVASGKTRQRILMVLGQIDAPKAIPTLMSYVLDTPSGALDDHRALAMRAILNSLRPKHAKHCFDFFLQLRRDEDGMVRAIALEGLGELGDARARSFLEDSARSDPDDQVRESASRALLTLRSPR